MNTATDTQINTGLFSGILSSLVLKTKAAIQVCKARPMTTMFGTGILVGAFFSPVFMGLLVWTVLSFFVMQLLMLMNDVKHA